MKVYFDIITNHTADVIGYKEGARTAYVSKDQRAVPHRRRASRSTTATTPARQHFPKLDAETSLPVPPRCSTPAEQNLKVPAWLNDVTLYHNRGNTTFTGENSPVRRLLRPRRPVHREPAASCDGMIDIYKTWIRDFGIDGFRIDTMKHVNDEFWQKFGPGDRSTTRSEHGKAELLHVRRGALDGTAGQELHVALHDPRQDAGGARLPVPGRGARLRRPRSPSETELAAFFANDDWYTDADSNVYELPTFLGNHDMGRIGNFIQHGQPGRRRRRAASPGTSSRTS